MKQILLDRALINLVTIVTFSLYDHIIILIRWICNDSYLYYDILFGNSDKILKKCLFLFQKLFVQTLHYLKL